MDNLSNLLQNLVEQAAHLAYPSCQNYTFSVFQTADPKFGHYQCNDALKLTKLLSLPPRTIAETIHKHISAPDILQEVSIAGPGFINLTLSPHFLAHQVAQLLHDKKCGVPDPQKTETILIDFSSPNVAKELHVGHLRSTIIGDSLARTFNYLGHDVLRINHIGDFGTQFGMLLAYLKQHVPQDTLNAATLQDLMHWYKEAKKQFDIDPPFKQKAHQEVVSLQAGDKEAVATWQSICTISRTSYRQIYHLLDIDITDQGESFYNPFLAPLVDDLKKRNIAIESDGALCIFLEGFTTREGTPLPMIIQKSDGGYNYDTTDLAALKYRIEELHVDRIIYVTDAGQSQHFRMLFQAAEKAGFLNPSTTTVDHVPFGVVLGSDGKKFKTRSGETEKLLDLLKEAIVEAKTLLAERLPDLPETELDAAAQIFGIDAIKYADLSCHRLKDYTFSYERMLKFEGNTAAFLLYAYVRIQGIKRKVGSTPDPSTPIILEHPTEIALALHLRRFPEALSHVANELLPNRLADYLYTLAETFHAFFRDCRVEGSPLQDSRLLLCEGTSRILAQGLSLLGLKTLDRM